MDYEKDFQDHLLETAYGKAYYKHHSGSSTPIIFIHGLAASTKTWSRLMSYMGGDLDIYLVDLLGHGKSDAPELDYTVHIQVEIIRSIVEKHGLDNVYLFGHSYGGWVSAVYAKTYLISGLILEDSAGLEEFYNEVNGAETRKKYKEDLLNKALALDARKHVIEAILDEEFIEGQLEEKDLKLIKIPTLIIWGAEDNIVNVKFSRVFQSEIKGSKLSIIPGARHTPHYTNPEEVGNLILGFVKR